MPELLRRIKTGDYTFQGGRWQHVTLKAKDLVSKMLEVNPERPFPVDSDHALLHTGSGSQLNEKIR